jgi:hypothetical protein
MGEKSCLSDNPILDSNGDQLNNLSFVEGLYKFIIKAETPVTIGIQGGWGSGKTSLINMLKQKIQENKPGPEAIYVFVNAWEHALFQRKDAKLEVTVNLLDGLLEAMKNAVNDAVNKIPDEIKKEFEQGIFADINIGGVLRGILRAGVKVSTGVDVGLPAAAKEKPASTLIRELRDKIKDSVISVTAHKDCPKRFVCFIDDLDRVQPEVAVEILDVIKNVFDLENCIFVLAIDYDVVVKGLEGKFGKKNAENEREFRQYFDKIIQVPFSMPVGAYEKHLGALLRGCFTRLGHSFESESNDYAAVLKNIREAALAATNGVPRSIKRIINTLSLLQCISPGQDEENSKRLNDLEIRFIVIALHINFPEISRRLMENPDFTGWTFEAQKKHWGLIEGIDFKEIESAYGDLFDEPWEQVVYCLCQATPWLKGNSKAVSILLNALRAALQRGSDVKSRSQALDDNEKDRLNDILSAIRVVSVENAAPALVDNSSIKTDLITVFCKNMHKSLCGEIEGMQEPADKIYAKRPYSGCRQYLIELSENEAFASTGLFWDKEEHTLLAYVDLIPPSKKKGALIRYIKDNQSGKFYPWENDKVDVGVATTLCENWRIDDFKTNPDAQLVEDIIKFCGQMKKIRAKAISTD